VEPGWELTLLREAIQYTKMALGLYRRARARELGDPEAAVREQVRNRERNWLEKLRKVVFADSENPYHHMFRLAGCGYEEVAAMVSRNGLEKTLERLLEAGVYLTHDEFKLKTPLVRGGRRIAVHERSFDNTLVKADMESRSSGSRSKGTYNRRNIQYDLYREARHAMIERELGMTGRPEVAIKPILPSAQGFSSAFMAWRQQRPFPAWFAPDDRGCNSIHYRVVTNLFVTELRMLGIPFPYPTYLGHNDFTAAAELVARLCAEGHPPVVSGMVSPLVRVAAAAAEKDLDIGGSLFLPAGEAVTDAKRATIEAAGGKVYPRYIVSEVGTIGQACSRMKTGNDVHLFPDGVAVIVRQRKAPLSEVEVDSLMFTTLLPFSSRVLINLEADDAGLLVPRRCDCLFSSLGSTMEVRGIYSYGKLTGQGITLIGTDVVRVLDEDLPRRFGGVPGDYQLVEMETGLQTQMILRVSPRVGAVSREEVRQVFLSRLTRFYGGHIARRMWTQSEGLVVEIAEPIAGSSGKILPLHLLGSGNRRIQ
jgi:hypothetical protein